MRARREERHRDEVAEKPQSTFGRAPMPSQTADAQHSPHGDIRSRFAGSGRIRRRSTRRLDHALPSTSARRRAGVARLLPRLVRPEPLSPLPRAPHRRRATSRAHARARLDRAWRARRNGRGTGRGAGDLCAPQKCRNRGSGVCSCRRAAGTRDRDAHARTTGRARRLGRHRGIPR